VGGGGGVKPKSYDVGKGRALELAAWIEHAGPFCNCKKIALVATARQPSFPPSQPNTTNASSLQTTITGGALATAHAECEQHPRKHCPEGLQTP